MTASARYMLDTNTVSYILKGQSPRARKKLANLTSEDEVCISAVTEAEVRCGLARRPISQAAHAEIDRFLEAIDILPWDSEAARIYGQMRAELERSGRTLANMDLLIAAHAAARRMVLVTSDRSFRNLGALLKVVDWADDLTSRG